MNSPYRLHQSPRSSHQQIVALLRGSSGPVLDVGAAEGLIGRALQGSGITIDAVEPNRGWADAARPFYRDVFACTIEQLVPSAEPYQTIVCGDVLEHLYDPRAALIKLRGLALPDARFIVSLPNVAHFAVRFLLLFGRFPQMDSGILDRTHVHFYTRDTATRLLESAGLEITQISATPVPVEAFSGTVARRLAHYAMPLQAASVSAAPRLFAMQWIFVARRVPS